MLSWTAAHREILMVITYNELVTFGRYGTAKSLNCTGIDFLEDGNQSWTDAPVAELDIQLRSRDRMSSSSWTPPRL
jgi:hypothetical protein